MAYLEQFYEVDKNSRRSVYAKIFITSRNYSVLKPFSNLFSSCKVVHLKRFKKTKGQSFGALTFCHLIHAEVSFSQLDYPSGD